MFAGPLALAAGDGAHSRGGHRAPASSRIPAFRAGSRGRSGRQLGRRGRQEATSGYDAPADDSYAAPASDAYSAPADEAYGAPAAYDDYGDYE